MTREVPTESAVRHFLDLSEISGSDLRRILDHAGANEIRLAQGRAGQGPAAGRSHAGDDLRQAIDADARVVRPRDAPTRRRDDHADRQGDAARSRRVDRRHRARALTFRRRDHHPHPRSFGHGGIGASCPGAHHQRADEALAPLPDHGRCAHLRGASRADRRKDGRLVRRRQQCAVELGARGTTARLHDADRDATNARPRARDAGLGAAVTMPMSLSPTIRWRPSRGPIVSSQIAGCRWATKRKRRATGC